jgi:hypothetical protein
LQQDQSKRLLEVLGAVKDDVLENAMLALQESFAVYSSETRLNAIAADRLLERYPTESLEAFRNAVVGARAIHEWRGTAKGIEDELERFGYSATYIPMRYSHPDKWAEFVIILRNGRIQRTEGSGGTWNIGMSLEERNAIVRLIRRWKNSDERLAMVAYALGNADFWGEAGNWGDNTTWQSGATHVIYARPYSWGDSDDTWNSSDGSWGSADTFPTQEG